jgi:Domain of unknown function (DUF4331)
VSHHLDSPASRRDPRLNVTDLYAFRGDGATVLTMIVNSSLAGPARPAGFHPEGRYEFKVHLDGAPAEQLTYRLSFAPADAAGRTAGRHRPAGRPEAGDDAAAGFRIAEGYTGGTVSGSGVRAWCGAAADPFYLDLHQLAHILEGLQNEQPISSGEWSPAQAASSFAGSQVCAIVLEIPHTDAELRPGRPVGVWAAAKLATDAGGWRQVNRAGIPMMWPLFRALGGADDSPEYQRDTTARPADDPANDTGRVATFVAAAARRSGVSDPDGYGRAVAARLLPMSCRMRWIPPRRSPSPASTAGRWPTTPRR